MSALPTSSFDRLDYWVLKLRALALILVGYRSGAVEVFTRMLQRWPHNGYLLASRAHLLAQLGRRAAAIDDYQALTTAQPERAAADWFNLAFLLEDTGRFDEAEAAFRRCVVMNPKLDRGWYGLGLVLIRQQRFEEAVAALKRNTELQPMSPYGWYQLARAQLDRQQPDETRRIIRHLKGFEPKVAAQLERETGLSA